MDSFIEEQERINRHEEFLKKLMSNEITFPNEFTLEMGKIIKTSREEAGLSQSELAIKLSRRQATISDLENGKIEIGILTLIKMAKVFSKPISYFIPEVTFLVNLDNIHTKWEEEALTLFRSLEFEGDFPLALRFLKMLLEYNREMENCD